MPFDLDFSTFPGPIVVVVYSKFSRVKAKGNFYFSVKRRQ